MLFSEPKIPQFFVLFVREGSTTRFSALQRAENSSIGLVQRDIKALQWSFSALQRAENSSISVEIQKCDRLCDRFSALQRAENSSMEQFSEQRNRVFLFQCSSASRKFLNRWMYGNRSQRFSSFSALQRAEIAEILYDAAEHYDPNRFQCSSTSRNC